MTSQRRTDLTLKQRYETVRRFDSALFARNISQKEIALQVGVSESTISNEKKRNKKSDGLYDADVANNLATKRRKDKKPYKFNEKTVRRFALQTIKKLLGGTPQKKLG